MRVFMVVVFVSVLVLAAWANNTNDAGAGQTSGSATIGLTNTTTPAQQ